MDTLGRNEMIKIEKVQPFDGQERWPVVFPVCAKHKKDFFLDLVEALVSEVDKCELCHPRGNDNLGG